MGQASGAFALAHGVTIETGTRVVAARCQLQLAHEVVAQQLTHLVLQLVERRLARELVDSGVDQTAGEPQVEDLGLERPNASWSNRKPPKARPHPAGVNSSPSSRGAVASRMTSQICLHVSAQVATVSTASSSPARRGVEAVAPGPGTEGSVGTVTLTRPPPVPGVMTDVIRPAGSRSANDALPGVGQPVGEDGLGVWRRTALEGRNQAEVGQGAPLLEPPGGRVTLLFITVLGQVRAQAR